MALVLNRNGQWYPCPIKEWTCNDVSEFPIESDLVDIPNGSICTLVKKPNYIVYTYDDVAKEWFPI